MILKKYLISSLFLATLVSPVLAFGQTEPNDIALAQDVFQDNFYESLKQKGIENYDKAIVSLEKCLQAQPQNAVVHFELGKNYLNLKDYKKAYDYFQKATLLDSKNKWFYVGLYDVCYQTQDYVQAIVIVNKLVTFDVNYKEDLTSLYMYTNQYDKALALITELDESVGKTPQREAYKVSIFKDSRYQMVEKDQLLEAIKKNPKDESNYISLIYLYSESNQEEKAFETAKKLEKEIPDSEFAQIGLFKFYLNNNEADKAILAMNKIFESKKINSKIKSKVVNEIVVFAKNNPQIKVDLDKAITSLEPEHQVAITKEIGRIFYSQKNWERAIYYLEIFSKNNPQDIASNLLLLQAYAESTKYDALSKKASELMEFFPMQPEFYFYSGLAHNQLKSYKKAKEFLETGLDYVVNNVQLEINFNIQLGEAFNGLGDIKKKELYFVKADQLLKQKNR